MAVNEEANHGASDPMTEDEYNANVEEAFAEVLDSTTVVFFFVPHPIRVGLILLSNIEYRLGRDG